MRGRKPALAPLGGDVEILPSSAVRIPDCPSSLQGLEREIWSDVTGVMVARSIYDEDCRDMVASYCVHYARFLQANEVVRTEGRIRVEPEEGKRGQPCLHPELEASNLAFDKCLRLAAELGLTPVARKRVVRTKQMAQPIAANKYLRKVG